MDNQDKNMKFVNQVSEQLEDTKKHLEKMGSATEMTQSALQTLDFSIKDIEAEMRQMLEDIFKEQNRLIQNLRESGIEVNTRRLDVLHKEIDERMDMIEDRGKTMSELPTAYALCA